MAIFQTVITFFEASPFSFYLFSFLFGSLVGSFLNVIIYRLPIMLEKQWQKDAHEILDIKPPYKMRKEKPFNLITTRSHCPQCKHPLGFFELIPIFGWLLVKGHCKHCNVKISPRYPLIELFTALFTAIITIKFGFSMTSFFVCLFIWGSIALLWIDLDTFLLPDHITLPLIWLGLLVSLTPYGLITPQHAIIGAVLGYIMLWTLFHIMKIITKREGMGYGDFKLMAAFGAWFGFFPLGWIMILSSLIALPFSLRAQQKNDKSNATPIAFGPALIVAAWGILLFQNMLPALY